MKNFRIRAHLDDGLFVVLIMAAAAASAALEAGAVFGGTHMGPAPAEMLARAQPAQPPLLAVASAASTGDMLMAAAPRSSH